MKLPLCEFLDGYARRDVLRLHMPGHKGAEPFDITEIPGADDLYAPEGVLRQSEEAAGQLFGCTTCYGTEGSSQCIRAMAYLTLLHARETGRAPLLAAGRNAHKSLLSALALLDMPVRWLWPQDGGSYLSCGLTAKTLAEALDGEESLPTAVYVTSPDYLGSTLPIRELAEVCHARGVLLLVDNAHGAYLNFLPENRHPIFLGADACCDSAHKTLPVLTGGAYLHLSSFAPAVFREERKRAMALFGSTSPSYLILRSLDAANGRLSGDYPRQLADFCRDVQALRARLTARGFALTGNEPLKLTFSAKAAGYTGEQLALALARQNIVCEFSDPDFTVCMLTPETGREGLEHLEAALAATPLLPPLGTQPPVLPRPKQALTPREAMFAPRETVPVSRAAGRILAEPGVSCPPAVPIAVAGEILDEDCLACFAYYGRETCAVVK